MQNSGVLPARHSGEHRILRSSAIPNWKASTRTMQPNLLGTASQALGEQVEKAPRVHRCRREPLSVIEPKQNGSIGRPVRVSGGCTAVGREGWEPFTRGFRGCFVQKRMGASRQPAALSPCRPPPPGTAL